MAIMMLQCHLKNNKIEVILFKVLKIVWVKYEKKSVINQRLEQKCIKTRLGIRAESVFCCFYSIAKTFFSVSNMMEKNVCLFQLM